MVPPDIETNCTPGGAPNAGPVGERTSTVPSRITDVNDESMNGALAVKTPLRCSTMTSLGCAARAASYWLCAAASAPPPPTVTSVRPLPGTMVGLVCGFAIVGGKKY